MVLSCSAMQGERRNGKWAVEEQTARHSARSGGGGGVFLRPRAFGRCALFLFWLLFIFQGFRALDGVEGGEGNSG